MNGKAHQGTADDSTANFVPSFLRHRDREPLGSSSPVTPSLGRLVGNSASELHMSDQSAYKTLCFDLLVRKKREEVAGGSRLRASLPTLSAG
jgi:hypothetical protein